MNCWRSEVLGEGRVADGEVEEKMKFGSGDFFCFVCKQRPASGQSSIATVRIFVKDVYIYFILFYCYLLFISFSPDLNLS